MWTLQKNGASFSKAVLSELNVLRLLLDRILEFGQQTFAKRDVEAARHIEPLEQVVDDMVNALKENHLQRLRSGECSTFSGTEFLNLLSVAEHISDTVSDIGVATIARVTPELRPQVHDYVSMLHSGRDEAFNEEYQEAHDRFFNLL